MRNLNAKALGGLVGLLVVMAALLFIPAWRLYYGRAWTFLAVFGGSTLAITLYLMKNDPKLLELRVYAGPSAEREDGSADRAIHNGGRICRGTRRARAGSPVALVVGTVFRIGGR